MSGPLGDIGTIEWSRRTQGILGRGEQARFIGGGRPPTARALPRVIGSARTAAPARPLAS